MSEVDPKRGRAAPGTAKGRGPEGRAAGAAPPSKGRRPAAAEREAGGGGPAGLALLNWVLLGAAALCIVAGYVLLDRGSITAAPILLVLGYAVLIPAGLLVGSRPRAPGTEEAP